ncbi:MAG: hypothetical protein ACT4P6_20575 [Gemmatimonadaceae bacterium]
MAIRGSSRNAARAGESLRLEGVASDPDGHAVNVNCWQWKDVDTYRGQVTFANHTSLSTSMQVPADATAGHTIHVVLEATDSGTPALTSYRRVVITVRR